jgi:hypothetical protein
MPTALIRPKMKLERLLTTVMGSEAKALTVRAAARRVSVEKMR